jgi:hypothetical protein
LLINAAYDSSDMYEYVFENTKSNPVIDTKRRRGFVNSILYRQKKLWILWYEKI